VERPLFSHNEVRRRVLMRNGSTTVSSWRVAKDVFGGRCAYCRRNGGALHRDHVVPLSRGGFDTPQNVVPSCASCNLSKGDRDVREWMASMGYNYGFFVLTWRELQRAV